MDNKKLDGLSMDIEAAERDKIVCAEEAFADSNVMSNAHYILRDRGIEMKLL